MLTSPLTGNCGNHMFSYAITRTVSEKNRYEFGFNRHPEFDYHQGIPQLDFMELDYGHEHDYKYDDTPSWIDNIWTEKYDTIQYEYEKVNYHPYQPDVFDVEDGTKIVIRCMQDARYFDKEKLKSWFKIKSENAEAYERELRSYDITLDDNLCILNVRGGEYLSIPNVLLQKKYWDDAMSIMKDRNHKMRFLCVTDDTRYANQLFDFTIPIIHLSIGGDYYIINNAKNLIISNSSFAIFPTWLNKHDPFVIAPFSWASWNLGTGYWTSSDIWTFHEWNFLDRNKTIHKEDGA